MHFDQIKMYKCVTFLKHMGFADYQYSNGLAFTMLLFPIEFKNI